MSADGEARRYTVVLTGRYGDERSYLIVDENGWYREEKGRPSAELLRGEITFEDLSEAAKREVLKVYREKWNLDGT